MHDAKPDKEHVLALGRSPIACAACSTTESAVAEARVLETRHAAASLGRVIRPMVILCGKYGMKKVEESVASTVCQKC